MKIRELLTELSAPMDKQAFTDRSKWAAAASSASGQAADTLKDVVKVGEEFVARWHNSTNTGWVQQRPVSETLSHEEEFQFRSWQDACRHECADCQFSGAKGIGMQAVDWTSTNNRVIGDWDGRTMKGSVYPLKEATDPQHENDKKKMRKSFLQQLIQAKADHAELPQNPQTQDHADALDDSADNIRRLEKYADAMK